MCKNKNLFSTIFARINIYNGKDKKNYTMDNIAVQRF